MTRIVDFIFLIFAAFLGKKALLLSVFAFMPSVFAADIPLATLSVDNIQVRAEWNVVGSDSQYFRMEGNVLMLRDNIDAVGKPDGVAITADVEVLDKFSTLNPSYEDLTVRVKITTVIMGCHAYWTGSFAKSFEQERVNPPNQIVMEDGPLSPIKSGDVIARRNNDNGYNNVFLHTVTIISTSSGAREGIAYNYSYMTTSPSLFDYLKWDTGKAAVDLGWTELEVNESETCFAEEIEAFQQQQILQQKTQYLNANAPKVNTGIYAGEDARVIGVTTAFVIGDRQFFWLGDVTLANILMELYPIKVINDDDKAFIIDRKTFYPKGSRQDVNADIYEYSANLTVGSASAHGGKYSQPHEVIIVDSCPTPLIVSAWLFSNLLRINQSDTGKVAAYPYVLIDGEVYKFNNELPLATDAGGGYVVSAEGFDASSLTGSSRKIKFADHFLCGTE